MKLVFLGPPGAGKGTLAADAAALYGIPHISTGDIFRAAIRERTPLGIKVKSIIDSGQLVGDALTIELVRERLAQEDARDGFILDGFPRTIAQADALAQMADIDCAVNFDISDGEVVSRLSGRRVCKGCGKSYHIENMKPKKEGACDDCGNELYMRDDDKPEAIKKRLDVYREQTAPLIEYFRERGLLRDIDARPPADEVLAIFRAAFPL